MQLPPALHEAVLEALAPARARWPRVQVEDEVFVPYLAARLPDSAPAEGLSRVHVADLFIACGCVLGDAPAIAAFQADHGDAIRAHLARIERASAEDLAQALLTRLLVGEAEELPRLVSYAGRSSLAAWLKVVATREALTHRRRRTELAPTPEVSLAELVDAGDDPELFLMRARHRDDFRRAFEDALAELDARDRTLLRYQLVDRLTIDELARLDGVHRATAARRLAKVREQLLRETRRKLMATSKLSRAELESAFRLVRSQIEVSVRRLLRS